MRSDHQGEKGELRFQEICHDAELNVNSSKGWDKTGWDFLVEFPLDWKSLESLEKVAAPIACYVQVKTTGQSKDVVKIPMNAALRMVSEQKPYFIYVLKVRDDKSFHEAWLIHVSDETLAQFLKKFRWHDQKKSSKPKSKEPMITLAVSRLGIRLTVSGDALKSELARAIGPDMTTYSVRKEHLKCTLGYEERRYAGRFRLQMENTSDLIDVFLGLKKDVPVTNFSISERRFGIESSVDGHPGPVEGLISLEPTAFDTCTVSFRDSTAKPVAAFHCEVYLPNVPGLSPDLLKVRYASEGFEMTQTKGSIELQLGGTEVPRHLSHWVSYWRLLLLLTGGSLTADIACDKKPVHGSIGGRSMGEPPASEAECEYWISLCEQAQALLRHVSSAADPQLNLQELEEAREHIRLAYKVIGADNKELTRKYITNKAPLQSDPYEVNVIYADACDIGGVMIGFWGVMHLTGRSSTDSIVWTSGKFELKRMSTLEQLPDDYQSMIDSAKQQTGLVGVVSRTLNAA